MNHGEALGAERGAIGTAVAGGARPCSAKQATFLPRTTPRSPQEKFSLWNDRKTGVNPFVPLPSRVPSNRVVRAIRSAAAWVIAAIMRGPFVAILMGLLWLASAVDDMVSLPHVRATEEGGADLPCVRADELPEAHAGHALQLGSLVCHCRVASPAPQLRPSAGAAAWAWRRAVVAPICSALLAAIGFLSAEDVNLPPRRLALPESAAVGAPATAFPPAASRSDAASLHRVQSGDVLICNHSSFADVLFLATRFAPVFMLSGLDGSARTVSTWEALVAAMEPVPASVAGAEPRTAITDPSKAHETVGSAKDLPLSSTAAGAVAAAQVSGAGPLAVWLEGGTRTNGRSVIRASAAAADIALGGASCRVRSADADVAMAASRSAVLHYVAVAYPASPAPLPVSPTHPLGSGWDALWQCMGTPYLGARVVRVAPGHEAQLCDCQPPVPHAGRAASAVGATLLKGAGFATVPWAEAAQATLSLMVGGTAGRPVAWNSADGIECQAFADTGARPARASVRTH